MPWGNWENARKRGTGSERLWSHHLDPILIARPNQSRQCAEESQDSDEPDDDRMVVVMNSEMEQDRAKVKSLKALCHI
jgi:hypothetical protein